MGKSKSGAWIGGTAAVIVLIFVATWFFLASPRFEAAAETLDKAEETRNRNDVLQMQVNRLRADFARLPEYREQIAAIRVQIPQQADLSEFSFALADLAAEHKVVILDEMPGVPAVVIPVVSLDGSGTPPSLEGFVHVPIQVRVLGSYANVLAFLDSLQAGSERLFLVTALEATRLTAAEPTGGKPEIADGWLELRITGSAYVLVEVGETTPPLDGLLPDSDRNPYVPLVPSSAQ